MNFIIFSHGTYLALTVVYAVLFVEPPPLAQGGCGGPRAAAPYLKLRACPGGRPEENRKC